MEQNEKNDRKEVKKLLVLAILAGKIMLKNGAETYRVEDTIERICKSRKNIKYVDAFVTPTGIFLSLEYNEEVMTYLQRIKTISIDLNKINLVNEFSRKFVNSSMSIDEALIELKKIDKIHTYRLLSKVCFGSMACAFFSLLFGGTFLDFISSYLVSFTVLFTLNKIDKLDLTFFLRNFVGALLASLLSYLAVNLGIGENMDKIIIGSIMSLVPGVSITNAIRDTISGDYVSGLSRGMEAVFSALAIAFGVGILLNFYLRGVI
jgi:uncharacterized membrane protein YjjP (DUF1212 family)